MSEKIKPFNTFKATVRIVDTTAMVDAEGNARYGLKYGQASGNPYAKLRGALSMGKDPDGSYKPAKFFDLVLFGQEGEPSALQAENFSGLQPGSYVTLTGRLQYEQWLREDGSTGSGDTIVVSAFEEFFWENERVNDADGL